MKIFIEHLREGTVPHDLLEYLNNWNIQFYEGMSYDQAMGMEWSLMLARLSHCRSP